MGVLDQYSNSCGLLESLSCCDDKHPSFTILLNNMGEFLDDDEDPSSTILLNGIRA